MRFLYFLFKGLARLVSWLPFPLLYLLSDLVSFTLNHVLGYRKKVILQNLRNSFPEKSGKELHTLMQRYYRNLGDQIVEVIKIRGMKEKDFGRRVSLKNVEVMDQYYDQGKSVIGAMGHCGNWEWLGVAMSLKLKHFPRAIVKPLTDKFFEKYMTSLRLKYPHCSLIQFKNAFREMIRTKNELTMTAFLSDQTPTKDEIHYWTSFLNQDTAVFLGTEKIAKALDFAVIFIDMQRKGRGKYEVEFIDITGKPKETEDFEITEAHVRLLESKIREHPDNWLWSHRRWKHQRAPEPADHAAMNP